MAAPPPALPPRDAGCLGVPAGALGPVGFGVAPRPVEVVPAVVLTQKYLWPNSDAGNKLPHTVGRVDPWKAILSELMAAAAAELSSSCRPLEDRSAFPAFLLAVNPSPAKDPKPQISRRVPLRDLEISCWKQR